MLLKNDRWIRQNASEGMIKPFKGKIIDLEKWRKIISYGTSSYGYDIRLSPKEFRVFRHIPGKVLDPKSFDTNHLEKVELNKEEDDKYFILPGNSYGLGVSLEHINIPDNITVICIGKSTYARSGIIANVTPGEAGWSGHLTLEFSNSSPSDCRIYANEGIVQLLFFEGEPCETTYGDRKGKYQGQTEEVTLPRV
ncbi:dCTP deaminase [Crocosphaera sp.]|uniref:dCTP deaminase n=1 Tax=Crocosphaera sp. TaxID=2729996 RepID=UPI00263354BE|nr:dCTP deaminase [Crocosphaera sp.]MDJ0579090.1 dCTP deaminase [Crocosphaera sp.]